MQLTLSSDSFYLQQLFAAQTHDEHKLSTSLKHVTADMYSHFFTHAASPQGKQLPSDVSELLN